MSKDVVVNCPVCGTDCVVLHFGGMGGNGYQPIPCPSCATFRAKLDREKLAKVIHGSNRWSFHTSNPDYSIADAIIAYLKEG